MAFSFLTWQTLATFAGAVGGTCAVVQLLKLPLDRVWHIPTRYLAYVVCLAIMLGATWFTTHALTIDTVAMCVVNAVIGTLAAMALYEQVIQLPEQQRLGSIVRYIATGTLDTTQDTEAASVKAHVADAEAAQDNVQAARHTDDLGR